MPRGNNGCYGSMRSIVGSIVVAVLIAFIVPMLVGSCSRSPEGAEVIHWTDKARKSVDSSLFKAVEGYWASRVREDWASAWKWEAPHVRFLWGKDAYVRYFGRANHITKIKVNGVHVKYPMVTTICMKITVSNPSTGKEESVYPCEDWIKVGGRWYHVFRRPFKKGY